MRKNLALVELERGMNRNLKGLLVVVAILGSVPTCLAQSLLPPADYARVAGINALTWERFDVLIKEQVVLDGESEGMVKVLNLTRCMIDLPHDNFFVVHRGERDLLVTEDPLIEEKSLRSHIIVANGNQAFLRVNGGPKVFRREVSPRGLLHDLDVPDLRYIGNLNFPQTWSHEDLFEDKFTARSPAYNLGEAELVDRGQRIKHTVKSLLDKKENVSAIVQTTFGQENYMPLSRRIFYEFPSPTNRSVFSRRPVRNEFFEWQSKAGVEVPKEVYIDKIGSEKVGTRTVLEGSEQHIFTMHWYSMNEPLDKKYFQVDTVDIDIAELEKLLEWPKDK